MKIKFLRNAKYPQNDSSQSREYREGEVYEVTDDHGNRWIRRGAAEQVVEDHKSKRGKAEPSTVEAMVPASPAKPIAKGG